MEIGGYACQVADSSWTARLTSFDLDNFGPDSWSEYVWNEELSAQGKTYLVLTEDPSPLQSVGAIIAVGGVSHGPDAEILTISVAKRARRRGLGTALLNQLIDIAKSYDAENVFLEVRAGDEATQRIYERAGFSGVGVRKNYYAHDDALVMHLPL